MGNRMDAIIKMVDKCEVAADIGTDHAYVPEILIKKNLCKKIIATDLNVGPYEIAKKYIYFKGLDEYVDVRLGNGLNPVDIAQVDTIIIAGMGGLLIKSIIESKENEFDNNHTLILQPMNASDKLRKHLYDNQYDIIDEEIAKEDFHYYEVIKAKKTDVNKIHENDIFFEVGEKLFVKKHFLLKQFVENKIRINNDIIAELEENNAAKIRRELLRNKNLKMMELMKFYGIE
jgi:tRNA (adenine22-N1)-methyltransferase